MVKFCPDEKCRWYSDPSKYGRKCFYEPNCWRGYLDVLISIVKMRRTRK
ncbi:hypothetical protein ES702_03313 [subsurface metagenome]